LLTTDDYEVYIDKNILKPLEMYRTYFDTTPYHLLPHRSHSYLWKDGAPVEARFDHNTGITVSNGGLNAPLTDMARYMDFLIGNPERRAIYDGVLSRSSLEEMWKPVAAVEGGQDGGARIGLSFFLEEHGGGAGWSRRPRKHATTRPRDPRLSGPERHSRRSATLGISGGWMSAAEPGAGVWPAEAARRLNR